MIKTLFIDENNQLFLFHPQTLYYINTVEKENRRLGEFLYSVLWNGRATWEISKEEHQTDDLMGSLIFKALPELKSEEIQSQKFAVLLPEISELFAIDFAWLSTKKIYLLNNLKSF